jgi:hypothetical protein
MAQTGILASIDIRKATLSSRSRERPRPRLNGNLRREKREFSALDVSTVLTDCLVEFGRRIHTQDFLSSQEQPGNTQMEALKPSARELENVDGGKRHPSGVTS